MHQLSRTKLIYEKEGGDRRIRMADMKARKRRKFEKVVQHRDQRGRWPNIYCLLSLRITCKLRSYKKKQPKNGNKRRRMGTTDKESTRSRLWFPP